MVVGTLRGVWRVVVRATVLFHHDRCFDRATVIAYFGLLSFLPLAVLLLSVGALALGGDSAEHGAELFFRNLLYRMPPELMDQVKSLQEQAWSGLAYLVLVVWTASHVFTKIEAGLDHVFRVPSRRHYAVRRLLAFALVALMSVVLVATVLMEGLLSAVDRFIDTTALAPLKSWSFYQVLDSFVTRTLIPFSVTVLAFFVIYWWIPAQTIPWRVALVGAVVGGMLWSGLKIGFSYYITHVADYTRTYGALATVIVFLLWANLSASLLLWSGEVAAVVGGLRDDEES